MQAIKVWLHTIFGHINRSLSESTDYFLPHASYISVIGIIGFPSYYVIWKYIFPQPYESLTLRLIGSLLYGGLIIIHLWPTWVQKYKNIYWLITITYTLPFFFTYMLLMNSGNLVWSMSMMAGLALLILLAYNWILFVTTFSLGLVFALCAYMSVSEQIILKNYLVQLLIYLFLIVTSSITFYYPYKLKQEKLKLLASVGAEICHELRTPLMTIQNNAYGLDKNLPKLLDAYEQAKAHGLITNTIRPDAYKRLEHSIKHIEKEVMHSNTIIDMLLMNLRENQPRADNFAYFSMAETIKEAVYRYPFDSEASKKIISTHLEEDFIFFGSDMLMMHVIFNLIKNALVFTKDTTESSIRITLKRSSHENYVSFRDNGKGIPLKDKSSIFENFYSSGNQTAGSGTGIGLAFCKKVLMSFNANIKCYSELGEYTEFVLNFPKQLKNMEFNDA